MRQTFSILLILVTTLSFSQEYYDMDMTREKPKLKNYYLETTKLIDSTGGKPYVSGIQIFDKKGRHKIDYEFDRNGDTIESIQSNYPDKLTEIQIHSNKTEKSDTAVFKYNKRNQQTVEIWKWGEDETTDTTKYHYNNENKLSVIENIYDFGTSIDSLFYKDKKIITSKSYGTENSLNDSITYHYEKNKLVSIKKYNSDKVLISDYVIVEKDKKIKRIELKTRLFKNKEFKNKALTEIEHYNNGEIKSKKVSEFINGQISKMTEFEFSETGFLKQIKVKDKDGNVINAHKITLHNKV